MAHLLLVMQRCGQDMIGGPDEPHPTIGSSELSALSYQSKKNKAIVFFLQG
jgi:hypothetical protein